MAGHQAETKAPLTSELAMMTTLPLPSSGSIYCFAEKRTQEDYIWNSKYSEESIQQNEINIWWENETEQTNGERDQLGEKSAWCKQKFENNGTARDI